MQRSSSLCAFLLISVALPSTAQTTTTGEMSGYATDTSGAVVQGIVITLTRTGTGTVREAASAHTGAFRFSLLAPGTYTVLASSSTLASRVEEVSVAVGKVASLKLVVSPRMSTQTVDVSDAQPLLPLESPDLRTTFSKSELDSLPMPGGDITTPAFVVPGIVMSTGAGYGSFSSHGLPGTSNLFSLNGNDNMDPYLNTPLTGASNLTLGLNELAEVSIIQNPYDVSYGRQAGAQVAEVTRSGTNQVHADLRWDWNGALLNANDFFANATGTPRGRSTSNQYAAALGAPLRRNKTFFFLDTEGLRYALPLSETVTVPSPAYQNYVLAHVPSSQSALYQQAFALYNAAPGISRAVPVTTGFGTLQDQTGTLGCGSQAGRLPNGLGITVPCSLAFQTNTVNQTSEWLMSARVDHSISDKQKLFIRFHTGHGLQPAFTDPISPAFNVQSSQPEYEGQLDHTYLVSPRLVNHFIGSANWYSWVFGPASMRAALSAFSTYWQFVGTGGANGSGNSFSALGLLTPSVPQGRRAGQGQLSDDLSFLVGNHTLKFGVNFRRNRITDLSSAKLTEGGAYVFYSGQEFANAVLGSGYSYYEQRYSDFAAAHFRLYNLGSYVQDEWNVSKALTLTLGIRFDRTGNPTCLESCFARFLQPFGTIANAAAVPYNQSVGTGAHLAPGIEPLVYQPRVAFAWSPDPNRKTSLRGGIGLFADLFPAQVATAIADDAPNTYTPHIFNASVGGAATPGTAPLLAAAANTAFQQGFRNGATLSQIQAVVPQGFVFAPPAFTAVPADLRIPKYVEWNFEAARQLSGKSVLSLGYAGNHGYELFLGNNLLNGWNQHGNPAFSILPAAPPDPRFQAVTEISNNAVSNYHALTAEYRKVLSYGLQGQISYTWSHSLDDVSGVLGTFFSQQTSVSTQLFPYDKHLNYSNSDFDVRHNVTVEFTWTLPFRSSHRAIDRIVSGWTLGDRLYARSGLPYSVFYAGLAQSVASTIPGVTTGNGNVYYGLLATAIATPAHQSCTGPNTPCFAAQDFTPNGFGNYPRNSFRGPGYVDMDSTVSKTMSVHERCAVVIGASAYNVLNHPNFNLPAMAVNAGGGLITSTAAQPTSAYGANSGSALSGRVLVTRVTFEF